MPDNANGIDSEEAALRVKQVTAVPPQARATTPSKPVSSITDPTPGQRPAPPLEKVAMVRDENNQPTANPSIEVRSSAEGKALENPHIVVVDQHGSSKDSRDQPLPAIPQDAEKSALESEAHSTSNPEVFVQAPTPVLPLHDNNVSASSQETSNGDPAQVVPEDAAGNAAEEVITTDMEDVQPTNATLPPPPPIPGSDTSSSPSSPPQSSSVADPVEEKQQWLLPPIEPRFKGKKCLVLDLDETLVHSSFKVYSIATPCRPNADDIPQILHQADFTIPVEIEGQYHNVYVIKRPGVDQFMKRVGELYEVVVFTASVSKVGTSTFVVLAGILTSFSMAILY